MDATKRIVILGKTGAGKSSLANIIFGEEVFTIDHTLNSETRDCKAETKSINGRKITVIDTPGFFDTDRAEEEMKSELVRCITECAPGPHAFLIVLKVEKFTEHEKAVITKIREYFSEEVLKYATVLFTHGDQLPKGQTIKDFVSQSEFVNDLVKKCGDRCHVFDNKYWNQNPVDTYRSNQFQVEELLKTIDKTLLANKGGCYTNDMLQEVEAGIQQKKENIRQSAGNMSEEEITRRAKDSIFEELVITMAAVSAGTLLGGFFGVVVMVGIIATVLKSSSKPVHLRQAIGKTASVAGAGAFGVIGGTAAGGTAGATGISLATVTAAFAAAGAVRGGLIGYDKVEGAGTPSEAAKKTAEAVKSEAQSVLNKTNEVLDKLSQPK